ncbi:replication-relaxation family protein [Acidimicrobiales bacterium]|nr:replication-relaxation family protein [Acidimicrobiales bacterium]
MLQTALSQRDVAVLTTLREFRLGTIAQLHLMHFHGHASPATAKRVTRRVMTRLMRHGLVDRLERRIGGVRAGSAGFIFRLSPVGYRVVGDQTRKRRWEPTAHHVHHTLAITELAAQMFERSRVSGWAVEKMQAEPMCWRSFGAVNQSLLKPDLHLVVANDDFELSWFVEIDLATESGTVLTRKLTTYSQYWRSGEEEANSGVFPRVLWIAPDKTRADFIERVIRSDRAIEPGLFMVTTTEVALDVLTDFGDTQ